MSGYQRWVTYAEDDKEAWKCLVLARSLKKSLTTRQLGVIFLYKVSEDMRSLLEDEFNFCQELRQQNIVKFPDLEFRSIAKIFAWKLDTKFVFLDCNCLPLRNSDELFRRNEMLQFVGAENKHFLALATVPSPDLRTYDLKSIVKQENDEKTVEFGHKNTDYCLQLNLKSEYCTPMNGKEIKMICFTNGHPTDRALNGFSKYKELDVFRKYIFDKCISLCPELVSKHVYKPIHLTNHSSKLNHSVAIVGMAFRFPGADNVDEFWNLLEQGHEGICKVPDHRWTREKSLTCLDNARNTEAGFLKCPIDNFDAKFFSTNIAEMPLLDPQQRLMMQIVWEGLENAGIDPDTLKNTLTGVFGGWWRNDYKEMLQHVGLNENDFFRAYMGNALGTLTARISHFFELVGPSISTESGCSTSIVGVDMACDSLRNESCEVALAVGANLLLHPFSINMMNGVISVNGRCKTFDAEADGFGRAEGVAVLVLKRYADAVANGDNIWGLIRGSAIVQEGPSKMMGTPTVNCEALAMTMALERAQIHPKMVSYVETHGTGTSVGDPLEVAAVAKAYSTTERIDPLIIGSVKTNIGHTESVSGLAGIIKTVLAMKHELIPQHLNFKTLSPDINLSAIPAKLPLQAIPWKKSTQPRIAGVSSFGITGTDAHVIVQEAPNLATETLPFYDSRPIKLFTLSAKSVESFSQQIKTYKKFLSYSSCSLDDIECTMHTGRAHFSIRWTFVGESMEEFLNALTETEEIEIKAIKPIASSTPKLCFLFTGQGSQYFGMAHSLYKSSVVFASHFDHCETLLSSKYGFSIKNSIWTAENGKQLQRTLYSQTSIFVVEYCLLKLWESWGITPNTVVGHSLGEFAAAVAAEMLTLEDALKLVVTRSKLIDSLPNASMLVVGADLQTVEKLLKQAFEKNPGMWLDIAAVNTPEQTVLAGPTENIKNFEEFCNNNKTKTHVLDASHAFHSRLMEPMLKEYEAVASTIKYKERIKNCTFVSGMEGKVVKKLDANYFVRHTREKVRFSEASQTVFNEGDTVFLEIGPHPVLSAMIMINSETADLDAPPICVASLRKKTEDWTTILTGLGKLYEMGVPVNWQNFHRCTNAKKVDIPGYCFEESPHWMAIPSDGSLPFHPLLGAFIPNPSDTKIFKNEITLQRLPFLLDHVLGEHIIFPGAGFIEMSLTAGYAAMFCPEGSKFTKPSAPISIKNFSIEAPLRLDEKTSTQCQVVVNKSPDNGQTLASIYTKLDMDESNFKWVRHTTATFSPTSTSDTKTENWKSIVERCGVEMSSEFDYSTLDEYGFKFGPCFKNLRKAWKNPENSEEVLFQFCTNSTTNLEHYLLHPCLIDSMFQAQILNLGKNTDKSKQGPSKLLIVPVQVESFTLWNQLTTKTGFIHVSTKAEDKITVELYDTDGLLIATMIGVEFVETTLANIMSMIESQRNPFPTMYELQWREELGPQEKRIPDHDLGTIDFNYITSHHFSERNVLSPEEQVYYDESNTLVALYMLKALLTLGLESHPLIHWPEIGKQLKVLPHLEKFLRYILIQMTQEGWLKIRNESLGEMVFEVISSLPDLPAIKSQIDMVSSQIKAGGVGNIDLTCVAPFGEKLAEILTGTQSVLPMLFPEATNQRGPAEIYYTDSLFAKKTNGLIKIIKKSIIEIASYKASDGGHSIARILEVGAGVGSGTYMLINDIKENKLESRFEYTYTDLSQLFLQRGQDIFKETEIAVKFGILNIEEDPTTQGFIPAHYDIVFAVNVLHATRDIEESLGNCVKLLKPQGLLILMELTKPNRSINLLFGGLEQFWRFSDYSLRPYNCEISAEKWTNVMGKCGFGCVNYQGAYNSNSSIIVGQLKSSEIPRLLTDEAHKRSWIVFGDKDTCTREVVQWLENIGRNVVLIRKRDILIGADIAANLNTALTQITEKLTPVNIEGMLYLWGLGKTNKNYQEICQPYFYICKYLFTWNTSLKFVVFTRGNLCVGPTDFNTSAPHPSPLIAMTNTMCNENLFITGKSVDLDTFLMDVDLTAAVGEALTEIFLQDKEHLIAFRQRHRHLLRMQQYKVKNTALALPRSSHYRMILPTSNMISDLQFAPFEQKPLKQDEVEVQVKAYSLNFKDLMVVLKPDPIFEMFNTVGLDYAGKVTAVGSGCTKYKVGDRVVGIRMDGGDSMASHVHVAEKQVISMQEEMTYCDAATLPAVFCTVYVCLIETAKIKEGDVVLIHTATGGVGLCAISVALQAKCTVVATAGNEKKRNYLRSLGIKHVFNSRSTAYQQDIEKALGGRGVDVVLNSLTGVGFKEATLAVCAPAARFVEMSKMNIWSKEQVQAIRPDVVYDIVDLSSMSEQEIDSTFSKVSRLLQETKEDSSGKTLPYTRFDCTEIRKALEYMEKAKHIGKIIVSMSDNTTNTHIQLFNDNSTYLITGGLGGIGIEVADWMCRKGAKNLLLVGRNAPKKKVLEKIHTMTSDRVNVSVQQCDIGDFDQCAKLVGSLKELGLPPLRGIMHAAGVLADETLENMTWEMFEAVYNPKVRGGWNLHLLTLTLPFPLEHFVMFSSMSALICPMSQSNHSSANYFLDSLVHYRNSLGLPATTVNWGQWGQVGVAANLSLPGVRPFTTRQGLAVLEHVMLTHKTQTIPLEADLRMMSKYCYNLTTVISEISARDATSSSFNDLNSDALWEEYDATQSREEKCNIVKNFIKTIIRRTLKMGKNEEIDDHANFQDIGLDSLMMVEMKNGLQQSMGKRVKISINSVRDCKTVHQLGKRLVELISGKEEIPPPTAEELKALILADSVLPEDIKVGESVIKKILKISDCSVAFITGVTGVLGPYILREVLKQHSIKKVYCLMRENKIFSAKERLFHVLKEKKLLQEIDLDKVSYIVGDVSQPQFGLEQEVYNKLAEEVELVFNIAVKSGYEEYYVDTPDPNHTRNVNLNGVKNVLRFASQSRLKYVYHASTMVAETQLDENGQFWEDWPIEGELDQLPSIAYPISKYVSDLLVSQAVQRGIPCKAFRFPYIGGDSVRGGNFQVMDGMLMMRCMVYLTLGCMPARNVPISILPVDLCATFSVSVFFNDKSGHEMFNVVNPHLGDEREFDEIAEDFGVFVNVLEPQEFVEKLKSFNDNEQIADFIKSAIPKEHLLKELSNEVVPAPLLKWLEGDKEVFLSRKLTKLIPQEYPASVSDTWEYLKKDLQYAKDIGAFDKFGIKQTMNRQK